MVNVTYKRSLLTIKSVWFSQNVDVALKSDCDIIYYHQMIEKPDSPHSNFQTLWTDLTMDEESVMELMDKKVRYEIRRGRKDAVETVLYNSSNLVNDPSILKKFSVAYNHFMKTKNLQGKFNHNAVEAYIKAGNFFVSVAKYEGESYVYHAYVGDGSTARLIYSVSLFRDENDKGMRGLIGRANRLLHIEDMLSFKGLNFSIYDWGGYSEREDVKSIAEFKKSFGGRPVTVYNTLIPCSVVGRLALRMKR